MIKLLLAAAIPFQTLVDKTSPTHGFINRQVVAILAADQKHREATWLNQYLDDFSEGCDWADSGWKNIGHMYDPETGLGVRGWPSAPQLAREYWESAKRYFAERNFIRSFFYLGAASHLVQDLCVPHHAAARVFSGHRKFEGYAQRYRHRYAAHDGGLYRLARTPEGWVFQNADYTRKHYSHCLQANLAPALIHEATSDLLPRAQRTTAGFVTFFLESMGVA